MNPPRHSSKPWSNSPTPINRYRPLGGAHASKNNPKVSAAPSAPPRPSFRNKNRKRGAVLTQQGWQKLMKAGALCDNFGKRYTYEELSERSLLDARTVSRVINCEVKVDKRTLITFFRAFDLRLESGDYSTPSMTQEERLQEDVSRGDTIVPSLGDTTTEELMYLRQRLIEDCNRLFNLIDSSEAEKR